VWRRGGRGKSRRTQTFGGRLGELGKKLELGIRVAREQLANGPAEGGHEALELPFSGVTTIEIDAFMGYVQVRFPPGVQVESRGHALIGFFSFKGDGAAPAGDAAAARAIVRVTGRVTFGFAEGR
jgi:hypothetical protein